MWTKFSASGQRKAITHHALETRPQCKEGQQFLQRNKGPKWRSMQNNCVDEGHRMGWGEKTRREKWKITKKDAQIWRFVTQGTKR